MNRLRWICAVMCLAMLAALLPCAIAESESEIVIPEVTVKTFEVPEIAAMALLADMGVGWNLGNTFDATQDSGVRDDMAIEAAWCGCYTTEEMIETLAASGFKTLRLPVSWHNHVDADFNINAPWLDRVQQVADWALDRGMYVILNTHHDVYPAYYYPDEAHYDSSLRYLTAIWTQVAERFADYGDHLIFESMNEPRLKDTDHEWYLDQNNAECKESAEVINRLNQAFVDTVRASGGNNADRYLMVPAYDASPDNAVNALFRLPEDAADNRIIISAHAYTPYSFALQDGGMDTFKCGNLQQTGEIGRFMNALYDKYISQGVPVVIGEFGARDKKGNLQARVDYAAYYAASARARNIPCCWWDNGAFSGNGEIFAILNRKTAEWAYPEIAEALLRYGA